MKDSGKWAIVFTVLNLILIVVCVVLLLNRDRKAPMLSFSENDLIYYSGIDNEKLLQGVAAMDAKDGDVSDRIVVEKIVQNKNENRAVVYYAVTDLDGNAAKASRVFEAVDEATGNAMKDIGMAGFDGDMEKVLPADSDNAASADAENEEQQEDTDDTDETVDTQEEDAEAEASPSMSPSPSISPTPDADELRRREQEEADRKAQEEEEERQREEARRKAEEEAAAKAGNPRIVLKNTTVNATAGQLPAWVDAVGSFQDDKDGYETLFKNLKASKYDVNAKGDHAVTLTTTDSDGNVSDPVTVTVHVK